MANDLEAALGTTPDELASKPGLLLDIGICLLPRRLAVAYGLLVMLGGNAREKVRSILGEIDRHGKALRACDVHTPLADQFLHAREVTRAVGKLETAVFSLVGARLREGRAVVTPLAAG